MSKEMKLMETQEQKMERLNLILREAGLSKIVRIVEKQENI